MGLRVKYWTVTFTLDCASGGSPDDEAFEVEEAGMEEILMRLKDPNDDFIVFTDANEDVVSIRRKDIRKVQMEKP